MTHPMSILGKNKAIKIFRSKPLGNSRKGQTTSSSSSPQAAKAGIITLTKRCQSCLENYWFK